MSEGERECERGRATGRRMLVGTVRLWVLLWVLSRVCHTHTCYVCCSYHLSSLAACLCCTRCLCFTCLSLLPALHPPVLQFTAPEGVVLLPPKVINCLWGLPSEQQQQQQDQDQHHAEPAAAPTTSSSPPTASTSTSTSASSSSRCSGRVYIKYKLLPKGTYVRFQPELRSFHEVVGADPEVMRAALEACLMGYCTLSEGDWVQVSE